MREQPTSVMERHRKVHPELGRSPRKAMWGFFEIGVLRIIASCGNEEDWKESQLSGPPWEHVSVSTATRTPTWDEMCIVKDAFWWPDEAVIQIHPPESEYVNYHPYTLHLWKPRGIEVPLPPSITVGPRTGR